MSICSIIKEAGGRLADIARNQIFLSVLPWYSEMNEVYGEFYNVIPPARYCTKSELVHPEFRVEISSIAHL